MPSSQNIAREARGESAVARLFAFVEEVRVGKWVHEKFEDFEKRAHASFAAAEAEIVGEQLAQLDIDAPGIEVAGERYRRVLQSSAGYMTTAGVVSVPRTLYRKRGGEKTVSPMELRANIVEGFWTPRAARLAVGLVASMPPQAAETLLDDLGSMKPCKASLDRLPKQLSRRWEAGREKFEQHLREKEAVPAKAVVVAVSLDGVMVPERNGNRKAKRALGIAKQGRSNGPVGQREAGCASLSFYDKDGERLKTLRLGRMYEKKKRTLKEALSKELLWVLEQRPDLKVVKVADGAQDNWDYLDSLVPSGICVVDFFHGVEHLKEALLRVYGERSPTYRTKLETLRHALRHDQDGVEQVITALGKLHRKCPTNRRLRREFRYFKTRRERMHYAELASKNLPIGSGVVEATCKTLVTQRLKCAGMRWDTPGAQAILTFRALQQSDRLDRAWALLTASQQRPVSLPPNVVLFDSRRRKRGSG